MGHVTRQERWGVVDLDTSTGNVFVRQTWSYTWLVYPGATGWTPHEKRLFHRRLDLAIWKLWSNHLKLHVSGPAPFPLHLVPINFDVQWLPHGSADYTILAWKVPPGSTATKPIWSRVWWDLRRIRLSSADVLPRGAMNDAGASTPDFLTPPHEFGHTFEWPDEYHFPTPKIPNPYIGDTNSIMNVGRQVRGRHLTAVIKSLNQMILGVRFWP